MTFAEAKAACLADVALPFSMFNSVRYDALVHILCKADVSYEDEWNT